MRFADIATDMEVGMRGSRVRIDGLIRMRGGTRRIVTRMTRPAYVTV